MELVLKLPKNKPPFIGVLFNYELDAVTKNKDWAENSNPFTYDLILEPSQKLFITLAKDSHFSDRYEVNYDPITLLKFLHHTKTSQAFTFGHLYLKSGAITIPRTRAQNAKLLFKIQKIKIPMLVVES